MGWSSVQTIKFWQEYRKHECLWNNTHPLYKDKVARSAAETEIFEAMAIPNLDVKTKIRVLRNTYCNALYRINLKKSHGKEDYESSLSWFPFAHEFLKNIVQLKNLDINENSQKTGEFAYNDLHITELIKSEMETSSESDISVRTMSINEYLPTATNSEENSTESNPIENQRNNTSDNILRSRHADQLKKKRSKPLRKTIKKLQRNITRLNKEENVFDIYGKYIATQLKTLPLQCSLELQSHIHNLIIQKRLSLIRN